MGWHKKETCKGNCWFPWNKFKYKYVKKDDKLLKVLKEGVNNPDFSASKSVLSDYVLLSDTQEIVTLPDGMYRYGEYNHSYCLIEFSPTFDQMLFELEVAKDVLKDFTVFLKHKHIYEKLKMTYKKGVLLYGPPGTGKTTAVQLVLKKLKKFTKNSIVIWTKTMFDTMYRGELARDPRLKIIVIEELTQAVKRNWELDELLTFLDGEQSINNCFIIATTNYPELLPANLIDRSGRFDKLYRIGYLKEEDRVTYLSYCLDHKPTEYEVEITKNLPISDIKEMVLESLKNKISLEEARRGINIRKALVQAEFREGRTIGFTGEDD